MSCINGSGTGTQLRLLCQCGANSGNEGIDLKKKKQQHLIVLN